MPSPADPLRLIIAGEIDGVCVPVESGERVHLRFTHSIYGSLVEETFAVSDDGFELVRLRYAELRTAEYYGHEQVRQDGEWWIVESPGRVLPAIALRVSAESNMRLRAGARKIYLSALTECGGAVRLSAQKAIAA